MKKPLLLSLLFACAVIMQGCKTDSSRSTSALTLDKTHYAAFELVQWNATDITFSLDTFQAFIDNSIMVVAIPVDSALLFTMPRLKAGSHSVKVRVNDEFFVSYFSTTLLNPVSNPDQYLGVLLAEYNIQKNFLTEQADSLPPDEKAKLLVDIQEIQEYIDEAALQMIGISDTEKMHAADILQANRVWMNELGIAVAQLELAIVQLEAGFPDREQKAVIALQSFLKGKDFITGQSPKIISWTYTDDLAANFFPGVGTGIGTGVGARIGLAMMLNNLEKLNLLAAQLLDIAFVPFENMLATGKAAIEFPNGEFKELLVTLDYRTPYNGDKTSTAILMNEFANAMAELNEKWDAIVSRFSTPLQFGPTSINDVAGYTTQNKAVFSDHLSISDISNTLVTDSIDRTGGLFNVMFSSTDTLTDINFNFNVNYDSDLGSLSYLTDGVVRN